MRDSFKCLDKLTVGKQTYDFFNLKKLPDQDSIQDLPFSLKILLENLVRCEDGESVDQDDIKALIHWDPKKKSNQEIAFTPSRVVLQDFTGVPAVVDLAAMREAMTHLKGDPKKINPLSPVELVIDHSVMVDYFGVDNAYEKNTEVEIARNQERYEFLRWGQNAFENFKVVPPGTGIVHQVNLEYLARVVFENKSQGKSLAYPDTLVGTDSHTTMINGLGVLGWGVGGIEAEAAMLGQPVTMLIPEVIGFELKGELAEGATATDLVLVVVQMLREKGVVGKFVEFYGDGLNHLPIADRATIANMSPEYGATCGIFPIDEETLTYLKLTGRSEQEIALVKAYAQAQGMYREAGQAKARYTDSLSLDLNKVEPCIAGPKRPQDRINLSEAKEAFHKTMKEFIKDRQSKETNDRGLNEGAHILEGEATFESNGETTLQHGAVVIAAITSCTNTSNPAVMLAAGLLAKKAHEKGLKAKPWVKTSLAPGSKVVTDYLEKAGFDKDLEALGFYLVGYGCTTCIGNSGPLPDKVSLAIHRGNIAASAVLSGNRNFEGRIHPEVRNAYLASPPLVVAYALAGTMDFDMQGEPLGQDTQGQDVYLKDIWPTPKEIDSLIQENVDPEMFHERYSSVFEGNDDWKNLSVTDSETYQWNSESTYVKHPPYFENMPEEPNPIEDLQGARVLVKVGDSVTTDHISPAGAIAADSPAGLYLKEKGVAIHDFNSYGSRRGNHEVMMRGTFGNIRLRNQLAPGTEGGWTTLQPSGEQMSIYDASLKYKENNTPLIVLAGKEYGTGSSRDWAAKGTLLLGAKVVIAQSYERIHRSNLIGMGVLPLQFKEGENADTYQLTGKESYDIPLSKLKPGSTLKVTATDEQGKTKEFEALVRIDTPKEFDYYKHGGILHYVLRNLAKH